MFVRSSEGPRIVGRIERSNKEEKHPRPCLKENNPLDSFISSKVVDCFDVVGERGLEPPRPL